MLLQRAQGAAVCLLLSSCPPQCSPLQVNPVAGDERGSHPPSTSPDGGVRV